MHAVYNNYYILSVCLFYTLKCDFYVIFYKLYIYHSNTSWVIINNI